MPSAARPPRRLPARVYWFRRSLVLGTVLALVFAVSRLVTGGGAEESASQANVVASVPSVVPTPQRVGPVVPSATPRPGASPTGKPTVAPAQPDGPCAADEVTVAPVEGTAVAGRTVPLVLQVTGIRPACTFTVSGASIVAKVSSSKGRVWSTQDCPASVGSSTLVVRSAAPSTIQVSWSGRGSDRACSRMTEWALPGSYTVTAAAIGSEPTAASLRLTAPERPIVIRTIPPKPEKKQSTAPTTPNTGP